MLAALAGDPVKRKTTLRGKRMPPVFISGGFLKLMGAAEGDKVARHIWKQAHAPGIWQLHTTTGEAVVIEVTPTRINIGLRSETQGLAKK